MDKPKAVVLLSGGMDSAATLAIAKSEGYELYALSFSYGQRHGVELDSAKRIASHFGVREHVIIDLDLARFGGSALTAKIKVPKGRTPKEMEADIPATYVPARNTVFLSIALAWAEALGAESIFLGVNAVDYSGYPDCRPEFIEAFQWMANVGTKVGSEDSRPIEVRAPLIHMTKADIVRAGSPLGVDYSMTTTCYDPSVAGEACGECDACTLRRRGFEEAGVPDPTRYRGRQS